MGFYIQILSEVLLYLNIFLHENYIMDGKHATLLKPGLDSLSKMWPYQDSYFRAERQDTHPTPHKHTPHHIHPTHTPHFNRPHTNNLFLKHTKVQST